MTAIHGSPALIPRLLEQFPYMRRIEEQEPLYPSHLRPVFWRYRVKAAVSPMRELARSERWFQAVLEADGGAQLLATADLQGHTPRPVATELRIDRAYRRRIVVSLAPEHEPEAMTPAEYRVWVTGDWPDSGIEAAVDRAAGAIFEANGEPTEHMSVGRAEQLEAEGKLVRGEDGRLRRFRY